MGKHIIHKTRSHIALPSDEDRTENLVKFGYVVLEICDGQAYRQTDTLVAIK